MTPCLERRRYQGEDLLADCDKVLKHCRFFSDCLHIVPIDVYIYSISEDAAYAVFTRDIFYMLYINFFMRENKGNYYVRASGY